jgi:putative hydrolase of the HAD superfamily
VVARTAGVFFDVDFTLLRPGPRFQGIGYQACCARHGVTTDAGAFDAAVAAASGALDSIDLLYDGELFVAYTRRIIEGMGGTGPGVDAAARELYDDWAEHDHFSLYEDAMPALEAIKARGVRVGLISNSHRRLDAMQDHFSLGDLVDVAVSSPDHGYMKPHPSIFQRALELMQVPAAEAVMVGDSLAHDVNGALRIGMRGVLLARGAAPDAAVAGVPVIRTLHELPPLLDKA